MTRKYAELRVSLQASFIHRAPAEFARLRTHGGVAGELIVWRMSLHAGEIVFLDFAMFKLRLYNACKVPRLTEDGDARSVCIQAMHAARSERMPHRVQDELQRVAIEPSARMHWERRGLVQDDDRFVFKQYANVRIHIGLTLRGLQVPVALPSAHHVLRGNRRVVIGNNAASLTHRKPFLTRNMRHDRAQTVEKRAAIASFRHVQWARLVIRNASRERRHRGTNGSVARFDLLTLLLFGCLEAVRAGHILHVPVIGLLQW